MTISDPSPTSSAAAARFERDLLVWFEANKRDLPWRRTRDPYHILVSEVMLQQTQVDRVLPYYERFLAEFPDLVSLATASTGDLIQLWSGLGYNRRIVNLQRAAQSIVAHHNGRFPTDYEAIRALPGVGDYTAGAIACFAFEQEVAFLDTNMRRVLSRIFERGNEDNIRTAEKARLQFAKSLIPKGDGWRWNQALIEFGALQCVSRNPPCLLCPARSYCLSAGQVGSSIRKASPTGTSDRFEGSPRYYRGLIVKSLHQSGPDNVPKPIDAIGIEIRADYSSELRPWLYELVQGLQRDGLAKIAEESSEYDSDEPISVSVSLP